MGKGKGQGTRGKGRDERCERRGEVKGGVTARRKTLTLSVMTMLVSGTWSWTPNLTLSQRSSDVSGDVL